MLAYLVLRRKPGERARIKAVLRGLGEKASRMEAVAQALIRGKLLNPRSFVMLRNRIEDARRVCRGCKREFLGMPSEVPKVRRCPCGRTNRIPAITLRDDDNPGLEEEPPPGPARFVGPYRVLGRIGDGGMGSIFRVSNGEGELFALKRLHSGASGSARERFRREAEVLSRLSHPHVVKVFDLAVDEKGRPYFTMELVEGSTLHKLKGRLEPEVFVSIVARAAEGLHHAHEHGLVHRDVKPHNIVVGRKGDPKVVDFGLARDVTANTLTQEGDLLGTPLYMAPEQLRGEHDTVDRRADIYSLGALLYEGLCGRLPIVATSLVELREQLDRGEIPRPSDLSPAVSPALEAVVMRALSKRPEDRQDTALTLSLDLRRALRRPNDAPVAPRIPGRLRWVALIAGLFGVLSLSLAGALFLRRRGAQEDRKRAAGEVRQTFELARKALERAQVVRERADAVAAAREALSLSSGGVTDTLRSRLDPEQQAKLAAEGGGLAAECENALSLLLAQGPFVEREEARRLLAESLERDPEQVSLWSALARIEALDSRPRRARAAAEQVVKREPRDGDAHFTIARSSFSLGELDAAKASFERSLDGRFEWLTQADVLAVMGELALAQGKLRDAKRLAREAQQAGESEWLSLLEVELALSAGDEPEACRLLEDLLATQSRRARVVGACVQYLVQAEDWRGAEQLLDARIAEDPMPWLLHRRAVVHLLQGGWDQARELLDRVASVVPADEPLFMGVVVSSARLLCLRGRVNEAIDLVQGHLDSGNAFQGVSLEYELINLLLLRDGPQDVERAEGLIPVLATAELEQDRALLEWRVALARSDMKEAERVRQRVVSKYPEHPYTFMLEARHLAALGRGDQLGVLHDRAASRIPRALRQKILPSLSWRIPFKSAVERLQRGCALLRHARATGGEETLRRAGRLFADAYALLPELSCAELLRISAEAEAGAAPDAVLGQLSKLERPDTLLVAAPQYPPARQHLEQLRGRQFLRSNRYAEAAAAFSRALDVNEPPTSRGRRRARRVRLLVERAEANEAAGDLTGALRDLDQALELDPHSEDARVRRSQVRSDSGDAGGAQEDAEALATLRAGPKAEVEQGLAELAQAKTPAAGEGALQRLRELQVAMDPRLHSGLFLAVCQARADAQFRWQGIGPAFDDLAALCQWSSRGIEVLYDLVAERLANPRQRDQLLRALSTPPQLSHVDPMFRAGLGAFLLAEFCGVSKKSATIPLLTYSAAGDDSASAPLLLAALHFRLGYRARARGVLARVFELGEVPPFAHYLMGRELAVAGETDAALEALGAAWDGGFQPKSGYNEDPFLESLYGNPDFRRFVR